MTTPAALTEEDLREMVLRLAHEIRNPLAVIKSGVQLMQHLGRPEGEMATCMASILAQVSRIDSTVRDMQRYVRIAAGLPVAVSVPRAVEDAIAQRRRDAALAGVVVKASDHSPASVRIDPANLAAALGELLSNAVRFSPPTSTVAVRWEAAAGVVDIRVDDSGPGIAAEVADRVARPFFSSSTQGTGLGINIALKVCQLAGGSLSWANRPEGGCRFTMRLPEA